MREILFKGKRVDNGEWVFGCYFDTSKSEMCDFLPTIIENGGMSRDNFHLVKPETVSQFANLLDKNENMIFEGDVHRQEIEHNTGDERHYFVCTWLEEFGCFSWIDMLQYQDYIDNGLIAIEWMLNNGIPLHIDFEDCKKIEIIGNIHEYGNK